MRAKRADRTKMVLGRKAMLLMVMVMRRHVIYVEGEDENEGNGGESGVAI